MKDVMLDLETWGLAPGCAIRSVGAVAFDRRMPWGMHEETFYANVSGESQQDLVFEKGTMDWWEKQTKAAKEALSKDQRPLREVAVAFHSWFRRVGGVHVWCQGATFDEPIWQAACRTLRLVPPWKFWDVRCTRTAYDLSRLDPRTVKRDGEHHNALDDAVYQAKCVQQGLSAFYASATAD